MFSKTKNKITKQKTKFLIMFLILYFAVLSTTQGLVKLIYCANQLTIDNIDNRQTSQSKELITTAIISTYLQLVHVHLITCQFLVILALEHFAFGT